MRVYFRRTFYLILAFFLLLGNEVFSGIDTTAVVNYRKISLLKDDTIKIGKLFDLGIPLEESDPEFCSKIYDEALSISVRIRNPKFILKSLINKGILQRTQGNYSQAKKFFQQAYLLATYTDYPAIAAKALINIGNIYSNNSDYDAAIGYYLKGIKFLEETNDKTSIALTYGNIGNAFLNQDITDKALEYAKKALVIALQSGENRTIGQAYVFLSVVYNSIHQPLKHIEAAENALKYLRNTVPKTPLHSVYQNISCYYDGINKLPQAKVYADSALQIAREVNNGVLIAMSLILKGELTRKASNYDEALIIMEEAKRITDESGSAEMLESWHKEMSSLDSANGNFKEAFIHWKKATLLAEKHSNAELNRNALLLEKKFQTNKKQIIISKLENEKKVQQLTLLHKNTWIGLLGGSLLIIVLVALLFYINTHRKELLTKQIETIQQQQIKELEHQKQLVVITSIFQGQEEERTRMAQDLHDGLGGILCGIKLNLSAEKAAPDSGEKEILVHTKTISQLDNAINEMHRLAHNMVPEALIRFGLPEAIQDYCDFTNESTHIKLQFSQLAWKQKLDQSSEVMLYRIIQELITNAVKHANASSIFIQLSQHDQGISITVEDNGHGFDTTQLIKFKGCGLRNVQSRVDYLNGSLEIESNADGTSVYVEINRV